MSDQVPQTEMNHSTGRQLPAPGPDTFSWGAWIGGFIVTLLAGAVLNIGFGLLALAVQIHVVSALIGAVPGIGFILLSRRLSRNGFGQGMLVAACVILLLGGICGFQLGGGLNFR